MEEREIRLFMRLMFDRLYLEGGGRTSGVHHTTISRAIQRVEQRNP